MNNFIWYKTLFYLHYIYVDRDEYLADSLFCKHEIPVAYGKEYVRPDSEYRLITCKIRKKYKASFEKAMLELHNKMLICGHTDYDKFCDNFMTEMEHTT